MKEQIIFLAFLISIVCFKIENAHTQIGSNVPNYTFKNVLNSTEKDISLNEIHGKIVILDFWATWCGACLPSMKKLESIQNKFKNDLDVIAVSSEGIDRLQRFIENSDTSLKIVSDTKHHNVFKYKTIPHAVIIDKNGIVRAITDPDKITTEVIKNLIRNDVIELELKDDFYIDPNMEVKVIKTVTKNNFRIELKSFDPEKRGGSRLLRNAEGNINGIEIWNSPIPRLYQTLFDIESPHRMVFKDGLRYEDFSDDPDYLYNMTIEVSNEHLDTWKEIGIEFLDQQLNINSKISIDTLECYVLKNEDKILQASKMDSTDFMFFGTILKAEKIKISRLIKYLENYKSHPILDLTHLNDKYDIELEWEIENPKSLELELRKLGLVLEKSDTKHPFRVMDIYKKRPIE